MPSINISASVVRQDISNNRSLVRLKMTLHEPSRINFSTSKSGKLQGQSFTYTSGASGSGTWTLRTRDIWVGHNSDGTKTYSYSGSFNIAITYSGSWISTLSDSGSITLPRIPRQSSLTSASMNANLKPNTANQINISISSQTNFGHWFDVYYGSTRITSYQSTGKPSSLALTASEVNEILSLANSTTKPTLNIRMSTRDGSTQIGSTVSKNLTATVDSSVSPSISSHSTSVAGSGYDKTINKYVQGISRVAGSFSRSAGYGASISESKITIEKTDGSNQQVISSNNGTISTAISGSGNFRAVAYVRDSRGRTTTNTNTFTVEPYTQPKINSFTTVRPGESGTTVNVGYSGSWSILGGSNKLTVTIERKQGDTTSFVNVKSETLTSGSFSKTTNADSIREDKSYLFRLTIRDQFGSEATSERSIGTAKTVFAINKNLGVGIGKRHEQGELDVAGDVFFEGNIELTPKFGASRPGFRLVSQDDSGHAYIEYYGPDNTRRAYIGIPNATSENLHIYNEQGGDIRLSGKSITANGYDIWTEETVETGSNSNGNWVRFPDGTQICQHILEISDSSFSKSWGSLYYEYLSPATWTYPKSFSSNPTVSMSSYNGNIFFASGRVYSGSATALIAYRAVSGKADTPVYITAIGRWK